MGIIKPFRAYRLARVGSMSAFAAATRLLTPAAADISDAEKGRLPDPVACGFSGGIPVDDESRGDDETEDRDDEEEEEDDEVGCR